MNKEEESFLAELLNDFKIEASEHYESIINGLILLEKTKDDAVCQFEIEKIFREVHSLKGASRAVNLLDVEKLCMNLETVFNSLKKGESTLIPPLFDAFHKASDLLNLLLNDIHLNQKNKGSYNLNQVIRNLEFAHKNALQLKAKQAPTELLDNRISFQQVAPEKTPEISPEISNPEIQNEFVHTDTSSDELVVDTLEAEEMVDLPKSIALDNQTVRISTEKLNSLMQQSEELIAIKSTFSYFTKELQNINYQFGLWSKKTNSNPYNMDNTAHKVAETKALDENFKKKHENDLAQVIKEMSQFQHVSSRMIDELMYGIKTTLLFPFSSMLGVFPKLVRDLSKQYSKDIELTIIGDSIEIDRRILEELKDPLIHLVRNSIDHGIENTQDRRLKGKNPSGKIEIKILQNIDRKVELHLMDDGGGLDKVKIINSAIKSGIIQSKDVDKLSEKEIYALIFQSGISTSQFITDISGRGLGMAIVAEKVNKLGGSVEIQTTKDLGTTFILTLPQTLSTFRGVLVQAADQQFIVPSMVVERAIRIQYSDIKTVKSKKTLSYNNEIIAIALLSDILHITAVRKKNSIDDFLHLLILNISHKKIAIVIDQVLGEQDGIVKDLGMQLQHVNNIAGTTILGNGRVVPILHPYELMDSASQSQSTIDNSFESVAGESVAQKRILVAEDSITIRTLIRNFIENAGYFVKTTVDGQEAYEALQQEDFDLVVSDIEMPRMNGFELTAKIREDRKHSDLPVILVTALETDYDKQRGMEAGANAYIVKSSFEKSNLVETIQRLI